MVNTRTRRPPQIHRIKFLPFNSALFLLLTMCSAASEVQYYPVSKGHIHELGCAWIDGRDFIFGFVRIHLWVG